MLYGLQLHQMLLWVRCGTKEPAASRRAQVHANDRFRLLRALELEQLGRAHGPFAVASTARAVDEVGLGLLRRLAAPRLCRSVVLCSAGCLDPVGRHPRSVPSVRPPCRATPKPIASSRPLTTVRKPVVHAAGLRTQAWDYRFAFVHRERTELYRNAERRRAPPSGPFTHKWCRYSMPSSALPTAVVARAAPQH